MQRKLIADISFFERKGSWLTPSNPSFSAVRQLSARWTLLLRSMNFTLPGYSHIYLMFTLEKRDKGSPSYLFKEISEVRDFYREVDVTVYNLPIQEPALIQLLNELTPAALEWTKELDQDNQNKLRIATETILEYGEKCQIPFKSTANEFYSVQFLMSPGGTFPFGGEAFINVFEKANGISITKKLFNYEVDMQIFELVSSLKLTREKIQILPKARLKRQYPKMPPKIELSITEVLNPASDRFYLTDMKKIIEYLERSKDKC